MSRVLVILIDIDEDVAQGDEYELIHEVIAMTVQTIGLAGVRVGLYTVADQ
jgi:hypothetical protein